MKTDERSNVTLSGASPRAAGPSEDQARRFGSLLGVMDALLSTLEQETALVRAGQLGGAAKLQSSKTELAQIYVAEARDLRAALADFAKQSPAVTDKLRRMHELFQARLQINLTVLATAYAVAEGVIRGAAGELARKSMPQTYGASGRQVAPVRVPVQPVALIKSL